LCDRVCLVLVCRAGMVWGGGSSLLASNLGGVGPVRGLRGGGNKGVVCGVGQERLGPSYFFEH
jgi:hypothetical protein